MHITALPQPRPLPDEVLTFEVALNAEGKKKATRVRRHTLEVAALAADRRRGGHRRARGARGLRRPEERPGTRAQVGSGALAVQLMQALSGISTPA